MNRNNSQAVMAPLVKNILFIVATLIVLVVVAMQLGGGFTFSSTKHYSALVTDTSGIKSGDSVRIAGVNVGAVDSVEVKDSKVGLIKFNLDANRTLPQSVRLIIRYLNLTGDRYIELQPGLNPTQPLADGGTIPITQTTPALDLDVLLAGFNPLFQGLDPNQINDLSSNVISVLQGEGGDLDSIFAHAASLTGTLADRDKQIGAVINNFNTVLGTLDQHSPQLTATIENLQHLVSGLSNDRERLGESFESTGRLVSSVDELLSKVRGPLKGTVDQIGRVSKVANEGEKTIDEALSLLPGAYLRISRLGSRGGTYNLFVCSLRLKLTGLDGKPFYTPWQGPNPNIERCRADNAFPLETPQQHIDSGGSLTQVHSTSVDDQVGGRPVGQTPDGSPVDGGPGGTSTDGSLNDSVGGGNR